MAGRRERQKQARERRILRAATRLFESRGYRGTGIEDIARRARLAVGTIYNYFPSKPDILVTVVQRDTAELLAAGEAVVKSPPADPLAALDRLIGIYVDGVVRHERGLWRELLAAAVANPEVVGRAVFEADLRLMGQISGLIEELQARGDLSSHVAPGRGAVVLYGVYISWLIAFVAVETITLEMLRAQIRGGIEVVLHGLVAPHPTGGTP